MHLFSPDLITESFHKVSLHIRNSLGSTEFLITEIKDIGYIMPLHVLRKYHLSNIKQSIHFIKFRNTKHFIALLKD